MVQKKLSDFSFTDPTRTEENGFFNYGLITFQTGKNKGRTYEVKTSYANIIELVESPYYEISKNDQYEITAGCNKQFDTCIQKFDNAINFRGEPHVPSIDKLSMW